MNASPALVTERGARRLPRLALWILGAVYVLPGMIDRDPWRNADLIAYAQMESIAEGRTPWWAPALGGVPGDTALLPHWLGAAAIRALPWLASDLAARLPFAALLALVMALVWETTYLLARTDAAQPVVFAFGGEASPKDYARAIADGALLALIATLGLLQFGHETTPELAQLFAVALFLFALAAAPHRSAKARVAALAALPVLAGSGAPTMAVAMGLVGLAVCAPSSEPGARRLVPWLAIATALAAAAGAGFGAWRFRTAGPLLAADLPGIVRLWVWFLWPSWLLALWTLWRWRGHLAHHHVLVPLVGVAVALSANLAMRGADRPLLLALPGMAVLAAFALPTLKRSTSAAVDWFSMFFFSIGALAIWFFYVAMQTGVPAKPALNVARLVPGFRPSFQLLPLAIAVVGTLAWLWLVRWRTGRHREAVWKSMVLPAGGVALCWLLLTTLWLPALDYARSSRALVDRLAVYVPRSGCVAAPTLSPVQVASLEVFGRYRVDARPGGGADCPVLVAMARPRSLPASIPGWDRVAVVRTARERDEAAAVYRRQAAAPTAAPAR